MNKETKKTIVLEFPVDIVGENGVKTVLNEVTIRRLKTKDLELLPEGLGEGKAKPKDMIPMIAAVSGLSAETVGELDLEDLGKVAAALTDFLSGYLGTTKSGEKSSGVSP